MKALLRTTVILFCLACIASSQARWTPDVMIKFKRVGGTAVSPDGKWIAYTVSTPLLEGEKSEFLTHVWLVSADGKTNTQFTHGEKTCSNPDFSPDGKYLSFVSARGGTDAKSQIWIIRLGGGEAEQLTKAKSGVMNYEWAPNSRWVAYRSSDPETEQE
ncbi:MAG: PD40 domain-containing protein, partial [Ignavibacteriales bacterium]|nr:PD40 domain-containing protein [Ignavibacteriales bacterium]